MRFQLGFFFALIVIIFSGGLSNVHAVGSEKDVSSHQQVSSAARAVKNIAYFEAGPYWEFSLLYKETMAALDRLGVRSAVTMPEEFHFSPGWDASDDTYRTIAHEIMNYPQVDLVICMGTVATKSLLAENNGRIPIVSIDVADPVGSGIIDGKTGKGALNLTLQYTKNKWEKVFVLFHQARPFNRLGIMYYNSPEGLAYSNVDAAREVARERGFELVEYAGLDKVESQDSCEAGIQDLISRGIDAFYISALNCFDWTQTNPQPMLDKLHEHKIWTYARDGSVQVRRGALMGLSTLDYIPLGEFYADRIARLLSLISVDVPEVQEEYHPKITLNLNTAEELKIDVPLVLLITADEIFDENVSEVRNASAIGPKH